MSSAGLKALSMRAKLSPPSTLRYSPPLSAAATTTLPSSLTSAAIQIVGSAGRLACVQLSPWSCGRYTPPGIAVATISEPLALVAVQCQGAVGTPAGCVQPKGVFAMGPPPAGGGSPPAAACCGA